MGGTGGETGRQPGKDRGPSASPADERAGAGRDDEVTEDAKDSFPASDPPGRY